MTTKRLVGIARADGHVSAPTPYIRNVAPQLCLEAGIVTPALQVSIGIQGVLARTQQDLVAALQKVAALTETNARLAQRVVEGEREFMNPQHVVNPKMPRGTKLHEVSHSAAQCMPWSGTDYCLFEGLDQATTECVERLLSRQIRLKRGDVLYRVGDRFSNLFGIRTGSCKTRILSRDGHEQVAGYYMMGEIIGLDGIGADVHECQATALEDTEVCPLPFDQIENLAHRNARFQHNLHRLLMHRYARARTLMILLGTMSAGQRLAVFLLDLSQRYAARGYSSCEFVLRMTREEIGSLLGLKLETISRLFSRFQRDGLIQVQGRTVKLFDHVALNRIVDGVASDKPT